MTLIDHVILLNEDKKKFKKFKKIFTIAARIKNF